ncbi:MULTISPECIES: hypothetical protein [Rhodopseudomonas]|uniref:Uncharacterized protein n=1 Tax=Rhodopseudomonas palustris TaxID=1076 RepID=A0A0D7F5L1_RHOPL|nr:MULTISPECIES: hypothetical protein [Rhodopseudomonas]KIZ48075.1 hypothetical protein OO17_00865 [Rhodopseudomonas palustris]MDF3812136.1 hypothetical protein [Rhodopseudomonas sp. BAL398]WOK16618.1 hypothetical protein RBJ75_21065 [Rhodopseudomonas sp. BAL398]
MIEIKDQAATLHRLFPGAILAALFLKAAIRRVRPMTSSRIFISITSSFAAGGHAIAVGAAAINDAGTADASQTGED